MKNNHYVDGDYQNMTREELIEKIIKDRQSYFLDNTAKESFSSFFMRSPIITLMVCTADYRIHAANDSFFNAFGFSQRDIIDSKLSSLKIWPSRLCAKKFFSDLADSSLLQKRYALLNYNGEILHFQFFATIYDADEKLIMLQAIDITALITAKKKLQEENHNFKTILENSPTAVSRFDRNSACIYVNKTVETLSGRPRDSFIGKTPEAMNISKAFDTLWTNQLAAVRKTKKPVSFAAKYRSPSGTELFYQARFIPELSASGKVDGILCTSHDITALKQAELHLRMHQSRYAWYLNTIPDILCKCDIAGNYLDSSGATKKLLKLLELSESDCVGKNFRDILPASTANEIIAAIRLVYETNIMQTLEYTLSAKNKEYQFEARIIGIPHTKEFLLTIRDITELKDLRRKVERLDRLQLVSEIASTIGHEIRNPLTTVCGFLQFMRRKEEYQNWSEQFNLMLSELEHSNNIISKFLALTHDNNPLSERQCLDELIAELKSS